mgnify:CR=1 FL=1
MLPVENRLRGYKLIENVKKNGKFFDSKFFKLLIFKREDQDPTRFAIVISTKVLKHATLRNKAARGLKESLRRNLTLLVPSFDCLLIGKVGIGHAYTQDLMTDMNMMLEKAKLIKWNFW